MPDKSGHAPDPPPFPDASDAPRVGLVMASPEEGQELRKAQLVLRHLGCPCDFIQISPAWLGVSSDEFLDRIRRRDWGVAIVAAGSMPYAPGLVASVCSLPVIALPLDWGAGRFKHFYEVAMLTGGETPMAFVAPGAAHLAALLAVRILAPLSPALAANLEAYQAACLERQTPRWDTLDPPGAARSKARPGSLASSFTGDDLANFGGPGAQAPASAVAPAAAEEDDENDNEDDWENEAANVRPVDFNRPLAGDAVNAEGAASDAPAPLVPPRALGRRPIDPDAPDALLIEDAVDCLLEGGAIALPTDTVYGLAVDATNARAVNRLYELKQRPAGKAITLLIDSPRMLSSIACNLTTEIRRLMEAFWPGPLTIIFEKRGGAFTHITSDRTIGVRLPDHPVPLALIQALARPLACTSANLSGEPDALSADRVDATLGGGLEGLLDAGALAASPASTVLDVTRETYRILRQGSVTRDQLAAIVGDKLEGE